MVEEREEGFLRFGGKRGEEKNKFFFLTLAMNSAILLVAWHYSLLKFLFLDSLKSLMHECFVDV